MRRVIGGMATAVLVLACNTILDNEPGAPLPGATGDTGASGPNADAGTWAELNTPRSDVGATCPAGTRNCNGICAADSDPSFGCGAPSCAPCQVSRGTAACNAGRCVVSACNRGFRDCNDDPKDGCETDLSRATSCGACKTKCGTNAPTCAPSGSSFACTNGCAASAPTLCGSECVSLATSTNHCGACNAECPEIAHGEVRCEGGDCAFDCQTWFHACGGKCVFDGDPTACGPSCITCPTPANAMPACVKNACSFACYSGFANCNGKASDGCEVNVNDDANNCGGCGKACSAGTACKSGACTAPGDGGT